MANVHYCKSWFAAKQRPTEIWDETRARSAHEQRKPYTILIGDLDRPTHVIEINNAFVGVEFLDDKLREALSYQFREYEPGKLFLNMATYREFDGDADRVRIGTTYVFDRSGTVKIRRETFEPHGIEEAEGTLDVTGNFDSYPEFGQYAHLCVRERAHSDNGGDNASAGQQARNASPD